MLLDKLQEVLLQSATQKARVTYCVWGKHGIGKTQVVEQVAEKLGYGFRNIRLSQIDPTELIGFPKTKSTVLKFDDGTQEEIEYLDYNPPKWYVDAMRGKYIIFLDELNRAKRDVLQAAFELVNERRLNGRQLPDDVLIVVACNPPSPKYDTIEFDEALTDRFCHVHVHSNYEVFTNWAKTKNAEKKQRINQDILNFLSMDKSRATFDFVDAEDRKFPVECKPSPRSWEKVNEVFALNLPKETRLELVSGIIGSEIAMNFFNSLGQGNKPITLDELIAMNVNDKEDITVERIKRYSKVGEDVIKDGKASLGEEGEQIVELALLSHTCEDLVRDENKELVKEHADKTLQFLTLIPADMAQKALKRLCNKRNDKNFWEQKLQECEKDKSGKPVPEKYVWSKLIQGLEDLAQARENLNPAMNTTKAKSKP